MARETEARAEDVPANVVSADVASGSDRAAVLQDGGNEVAFDERSLAEASIHGSTQAFEELYTHYFPKVRAFCLRKTSNPTIAEDIAQEAFARAFERIDSFGGPRHFGGWVGTIANNLITDHYRRKRNTEVSLDTDDPDRGPSYDVDPIRNLQRQDTTRLVKLALERLDDRQRQALMMHEVHGLTCAAVGEHFGISEVAAESLLARARRRLRKEITAKAAPADLFGFGGLGLLPALWRGWRRMRDATSRRFASAKAAAANGWENVGQNLIPSVDSAKGLVVVLGAALAVEVATAAAPPNVQTTPDAPVSRAAATAPALITVDGDGGSATGRADLPVSGYVDPSGKAGVTADGDVELPDPRGSEGFTGLHTELDFGTNLKRGEANLHARIYVKDASGETVADSGSLDIER